MVRAVVWLGVVLTMSFLGGAPAVARGEVGGISPYRGAILVDMESGEVLFADNPDFSWPPASMVKLMTVLVAMEAVAAGEVSLDDEVVASDWAAKMGGTQVWLASGERFPLSALLEAVLVGSANDASVAVAEHVAGSVPAFVARMNSRAKALGLQNTELQSVHGLPPSKGQRRDLMSARDLAQVARALESHPEVWRWAATKEAPFRDGKFTLRTTNWLLHSYPGITGLKTGFISIAGFGVTATARRNGLSLVAVVLGAASKKASLREAARLLDHGFENHLVVHPVKQGQPVGAKIPVAGGTEDYFQGQAARDLRMVVSRDAARSLEIEVRVPGQLRAPITQGQAVGEVVLVRGADIVSRVEILAPRNIEAESWFGSLW